MTTKKVVFCTLIKRNHGPNSDIEPAINCKEIFDYISGLTRKAKQYDLTNTRFCRLEDITGNAKVQRLLFKSATHKYRAPLIDRRTGNERENPKALSEGERIKTHIAIRYKKDEIILCIESGSGTLGMQQIVNYLNYHAQNYHTANHTSKEYSFDFEIIVKQNFLRELKKLNRVMEGELYINKTVLGSETLGYSNRITQVKHDIKMVITAQRGVSITGAVTDIFNKFNSGKSTINKIRVKGKNENDNNVIIDTELIARTEFVNVKIHGETGEVNTTEIFKHLEAIALTF